MSHYYGWLYLFYPEVSNSHGIAPYSDHGMICDVIASNLSHLGSSDVYLSVLNFRT